MSLDEVGWASGGHDGMTVGFRTCPVWSSHYMHGLLVPPCPETLLSVDVTHTTTEVEALLACALVPMENAWRIPNSSECLRSLLHFRSQDVFTKDRR